MAKAENIKVLLAMNTHENDLEAVVRFDYLGVGYIGKIFDKISFEQRTELYTEKDNEFVFCDYWHIMKGHLFDGSISQGLEEAMNQAFDPAYELAGW